MKKILILILLPLMAPLDDIWAKEKPAKDPYHFIWGEIVSADMHPNDDRRFIREAGEYLLMLQLSGDYLRSLRGVCEKSESFMINTSTMPIGWRGGSDFILDPLDVQIEIDPLFNKAHLYLEFLKNPSEDDQSCQFLFSKLVVFVPTKKYANLWEKALRQTRIENYKVVVPPN